MWSQGRSNILSINQTAVSNVSLLTPPPPLCVAVSALDFQPEDRRGDGYDQAMVSAYIVWFT